MLIYISPTSSRRLKQIESKFVLQLDNWNDYGFNTLYHLHYKHGDNPTDVTYVGALKILKFGQTEADYSLVTEPFNDLGEDFVSVGTSFDYYQRLNQMPEVDRKFIMHALRDAVADTSLVGKF